MSFPSISFIVRIQGIFDALPFELEGFFVEIFGCIDEGFKSDRDAGKGFRQTELVPTPKSPERSVFNADRQDLRICGLGESDDAGAKLVTRAARAVWNNRNVVARLDPLDQSAERRRS